MDFSDLKFYQNRILFGHDETKNIVAVEPVKNSDPLRVVVFRRENGIIERSEEEFQPFVLVRTPEFLAGFGEEFSVRELAGSEEFKYVIFVNSTSALSKLIAHLKKVTKTNYGSPMAPYYYLSDLVNQYLLITGKTFFLGMQYDNILRMQLDIETYCAAGFEFSNPDREEDRIIMISLRDSTGWERVISGVKMDEAEMLKEMIREIQERDPDVIEGHNLFKFDLDYIEKRAARHKIDLILGRDGSAITSHPSRMNIAERTIVYPKYEIFGRHIIDTWILAQLYDVTARELESYGLKDIARHFRVSPPDRTYIDGADISPTFDTNPHILCRLRYFRFPIRMCLSEGMPPASIRCF
jgi:DNA polymerase elongation subunit (family B)